VLVGLLLVFMLIPAVQTADSRERFTALAVNMASAPVRWNDLTVEMVVERWSTEAERDKLMSVAFAKGSGSDKLLDTLQHMPKVGYIKTPDSIGYDLHFAQKTPGEDGGESITLATDRPIGFWEATNRPRTIDYPFTVVELRLKPDGEGEGKMSLFAKIIPDRRRHSIVLENYGTGPVLLKAVKKS
jgi:hypothetical protein